MRLLRQGHDSPRRGSVIVVALFVTILVSGLTVAFLQVGVAFNREQLRRVDDERALFLAESGVQESLHAMRTGGTGGIGSMAAPARFGDGLLWVDVDQVGVALRRIRSVGMCGSGRVALEGLVFHYSPPPITTALFSNQSFQLESNVFIDSFDSSLGSYATQLAASGTGFVSADAVTQSNGDVVVDSAVEVHGDVYPGQDESVDVPGSSSVSGILEPSPHDRDMPPVTVPSIAATGALSVPTDGVTVLAPGDHHLTALEVTSGSLTIQGPARVIVDDFDLKSNTDLVLDSATGPIEIYATGDFVLASNSDVVTTDGSAVGVAVYLVGGPAQVVELRSNSDFCGTIYCPEGTVAIHSNFEIYGSVAADQLVINSNVRVHFDEHLNHPPPAPEEFFLTSWSFTALPDSAIATSRQDPFAVLGVDPTTLLSPADAQL